MSTADKFYRLYKHSNIELTYEDIEALNINLDMGHKYGLDAYFDESMKVYQVTRDNNDVFECSDIIELSNVTCAIVDFMEAGGQHQSAA